MERFPRFRRFPGFGAAGNALAGQTIRGNRGNRGNQGCSGLAGLVRLISPFHGGNRGNRGNRGTLVLGRGVAVESVASVVLVVELVSLENPAAKEGEARADAVDGGVLEAKHEGDHVEVDALPVGDHVER